MNSHFPPAKLFGVALEASDDPWTLQLKLAAAQAAPKDLVGMPADPFDAVAPELARLDPAIEVIGKFPIPSWLSPRPELSDCHLVTKEDMEKFVANGGMLELSRQLKSFVQKNVFPGLPIMLGVDHSATGGVVSALSEELGPQNLTIVVLDQHFDGLPVSLRMEQVLNGDEYCCGNFWKHLIDDGVVLPQNLLFLGVADYPQGEAMPGWERFHDNYKKLEAQGCNFFPLQDFEGQYLENLQEFIQNKITTSNVYVSLDLDVGAYRCVNAARYMDRIGIEGEAIMDVARTISNYSRAGMFRLAGLDVMELNVHYVGLETGDGGKDYTISIAADFIRELLKMSRE